MVKQQERELFGEWRQGHPHFVADGVFREDAWEAQWPKITFVLKETDGWTPDLCAWLMDPATGSGGWQTWNNVARWSKALLKGGDYPAYVSPEERRRRLARVSFLNLKKEGGGPRAKPKEIRKAARDGAGFLCRQLLLYQPDLIVCCGKWLVANILETEVLAPEGIPVQDREDVEGVSCFYARFPGKDRLTPVVDFYHPEWFHGGHARWRIFFEQMKALRALLLPASGPSPAIPPLPGSRSAAPERGG